MGMIVQGKELWRALFARTRRRVLGLFFGHPERSFYANEVVRRVGVGTGSVQRELVRLADAEILLTRRVGNQLHYQANPSSPLFADLRSMVLKTFGAIEHLRQTLRNHPAEIVFAYLHGPGVESGSITDELFLLLITDAAQRRELEPVMQAAAAETGRKLTLILLRSARYAQLQAEGEPNLQALLRGPGMVLMGSANDPRLSGASRNESP